MRQSDEILRQAYESDPISNPVPHADIQLGDYVEILGNTPDSGLPVFGRVSSYNRFGNMYTVDVLDRPRSVTGSRLRRSR